MKLATDIERADAHSTTEQTDFPASDFLHFLRTRRSIRRYTAQQISHSVLESLLEAARWAPSAHNRQPWRFCVVTNAQCKIELSLQMAARWRCDLQADGSDQTFIEKRISISHARLTGAPALIVACMSMQDMDQYHDSQRDQAEWTMAVQSVALSCQNLLLSAHLHGLGACWMCAPLFVPELVQRVLELPAQWHPQALITLGYPAEEKERTRAPMVEHVLWK